MEISTQQEYIPKWMGNNKLPSEKQVIAKLTSLSVGLIHDLEPIFVELCDENKQLKKGKTNEFYKRVCVPVFKNEYVELKNLFINGKEVNAEEAVGINKCVLLVMEIVNQLFTISYLSEEDEKNSEGMSGSS